MVTYTNGMTNPKQWSAMKAKMFAKNFPIVCVGGSVGGLDAHIRLLQHLPADMGALSSLLII